MRGFLSKLGGVGPGKDANTLLHKVIQVSSFTLRCEELVGAGGYASIYRVIDQTTHVEYALKHLRLPPDSDAVAEVRQEMKIMYQLGNHPNVLKLHAASFAGPPGKETDAFMVMDFCRVTLLDEMQRCNFQLDHFFVYEVFSEVCQGVAHMHLFSPPYAHRDIKAENVLKTDKGKWVLCDFGSATTKAQVYESPAERAMEEEVIRRTTTPAYRAPEMWDLVARQRIDTKVDIWALGVLLYVLVYGKLPFQGDSKLSILFGKYEMPPGKPAVFCDLIRELLTTDPAQRPDILTVLSRMDGVKQSLYNSIGAAPPASTSPMPMPQPQMAAQAAAMQQHQQQQQRHHNMRPAATPAVMPVHANGLARVSAPLGQQHSPYAQPMPNSRGGVVATQQQPSPHGAAAGMPLTAALPHMPPSMAAPHMPAHGAPAAGVHSHPVSLAPGKVQAVAGAPPAMAAAVAAVASAQQLQTQLSASQQQQAYAAAPGGSLKRSMQIQPPSQPLPPGPVSVRSHVTDTATRVAGATPLYVPPEGALHIPGGPVPATPSSVPTIPPPPGAPQEPPTATLIEVDAEPPGEQEQSLLGDVTTPTKKSGPGGKGHGHKRSSSFSKADAGFTKDAFTLSSQQQHLFEPDWGDQPAFVGGHTPSASAHGGKPGHHAQPASQLGHRTSASQRSQPGSGASSQRQSDSGAAHVSSSTSHSQASMLPVPPIAAGTAAAAKPPAGLARSASKGQDGIVEQVSQQGTHHSSSTGAVAAGLSPLGSAGASMGAGAFELEALRVQVKGLLATHQSLSFRVKQLEETVTEQAELIKALQKALGLSTAQPKAAQPHGSQTRSAELPKVATAVAGTEPQSPLHRGSAAATTPLASSAPASEDVDGVMDEKQASPDGIQSAPSWHPFSPKDGQ